MALLEKLRDAANLVKNKVQDMVQTLSLDSNQVGNTSVTNQSAPEEKGHPIPDETVRQYYKIVYGLLSSCADATHDDIKKYVEYHLGQVSDKDKLREALSYFYGAAKTVGGPKSYKLCSDAILEIIAKSHDLTKWQTDKLKEFNKELDETKAFQCAEDELLTILHKRKKVDNNASDSSAKDDLIKRATESVYSKYDAVLATVESQGVQAYNEGVDRIVKETAKKYGGVIGEEKTMTLIQKITKEKFNKDNAIVKKILIAYVNNALWNSQDARAVASVALRAAHFEKYGQSKKGYTGVSNEECRSFILTEENFKHEIDSQPYDTEKQIKRTIAQIGNADVFFEGLNRRYWMPERKDMYYADKLCNAVWKRLAEINDVDETQDILTMYNMIFESVQLSEEERQHREEEKKAEQRRADELEARLKQRADEREAEWKRQADEREAKQKQQADERRQRQEQESQAQNERYRAQQEEARKQQEEDRKRREEAWAEDRRLQTQFYVLYRDEKGVQRGYVNSYRNANISSLPEAEKYWSDQFNPVCYHLTFVKATESRLEYEQWTR